MLRALLAMIAVILPLLGTGCSSPSGREQTLVDRATLTVQDMMTQTLSDKPQNLLRKAKGVLICPSQFSAGFFIGGEGGNCVLLGRAATERGPIQRSTAWAPGASAFSLAYRMRNCFCLFAPRKD